LSEKDNHITQLFKKYLTGDISRLEQRALDQEVQENPYAQDAKEGLDKVSSVNQSDAFNNLDSRLKARIQKEKPNKGMAWMSMAAGMAVLVATSFLVWQSFEKDKNFVVFDTMEQAENIDRIDQDQLKSLDTAKVGFDITVFNQGTVAKDSVNIELYLPESAKKETNSGFIAQVDEKNVAVYDAEDSFASNRQTSIESEPRKQNSNTYYIDGVAVEGNLATETNTSEKIIITEDIKFSAVADIVSSEAEVIATDNNSDDKAESSEDKSAKESEAVNASPTPSSPMAKAKRSVSDIAADLDTNLKTVTGFVVDNHGESLIGANVFNTVHNIGVVSDVNGAFTIDIPNEVNSLAIDYIGYEGIVIDIPSNNIINAQLIERQVLSEVVVNGLGKTNTNIDKSKEAASPIDGNSAFKKYIKSNLVFPSEAKDANIKGKVVLLFNVDADGTPVDIEVSKSLGYGCDVEAIRLLREGPKWKQGDLGEKNSVVVRFR